MPRIKLTQVADHAGVSTTTASLVLNGKGSISEEVRDRVMASARNLGYVRNIHAAGTRSQRTVNLAILVNEEYERAFEWHLIRSIFISVERVLSEVECYPVLIPVSYAMTNKEILEKVILSGAGGVFIIHFGDRELLRQFEDRHIPVVLLNNNPYENEFHTVCSDVFYGTYEAARYILDLGHRNIGYVDYHRPNFPNAVTDRLMGFQKALNEADIEYSEHRRVQVEINDMESIGRKICGLFKETSRPTALVVHDDHLAAKVMLVLDGCGFEIPEDVSIIAPGDTMDYSQPYLPQISTNRINTELIGTLGAEMMLRRLDGSCEEVETLKVKSTLIDRGTCVDIRSSKGHR